MIYLVDISELRITSTQVFSVITMFSTIVFFILVLKYDKISAYWSWFPVLLVGLLSSAFLAFLLYSRDWFHDKSLETPHWWFIVAVIGLFGCIALGIHFTEPVSRGRGQTEAVVNEPYDYYRDTRSGGFVQNNFYSTNSYSGRSSISLPECHGDGCGEFYLGIFIFLVVVICLVASAIIPHFWLVAGCVFSPS